MCDSELWNELGNLYFISGAYGPAISAYSRAILLDDGFGRPYSNLALAYVQKGDYKQAIELYKLSIDLLIENKEKAATWYKLGNVHRQLKDYNSAILAYQKADELEPEYCSQQEEAGRDHEKPLAFFMPPFGLETNTTEENRIDDGRKDKINTDLSLSPKVIATEAYEYGRQKFDMTAESLEIPESIDTMNLDSWIDDDSKIQSDWEPLTLSNDEILNDAPSLMEFPMETEGPEKDKDEDMIFLSDCSALDTLGTESLATIEKDSLIENEKNHSEQLAVEVVRKLDLPVSPDVQLVESENTLSLGMEPDVRNGSEGAAFTNSVLEKKMDNSAGMETETPAMESGEFENIPIQLTSDEIAEIETEIAKIKRKAQANPHNAFVWDMLGNLFRSIGNYNDAVLAHQQAIAIEPKNPSFHFHLGLVYAAERRNEDAVKVFRKVIELDPGHTLAHASLGGFYRKMGLAELARHHIEKATSLAFQEENDYNRACLESICGNTDRALELLQIALQNHQSHINWARRDPDLDFIRNDPRFHMIISAYASNQPHSIH